MNEMQLFPTRKPPAGQQKKTALSEEQQQKNQLELPGVRQLTDSQERALQYSAHKKYVRQQVNSIVPTYERIMNGVTRSEQQDLRDHFRIVPGPQPRESSGGIIERILGHASGGAQFDTRKGVIHYNTGQMEIFSHNIERPYTTKQVIFHEGLHHFDIPRRKYSFERNYGNEFIRQTIDEIYAQPERFVSFSDPRRSAFLRESKRLSRTTGWETGDPLGIIRTFQCIKQGKDPLTAYNKGAGRAKYVLGRAVILELIRKGTVKKPGDIYHLPPELLKKEITRTLAKSPFLYAGHFARSVLSVPKASMEKIAAAMRKKNAPN